MRRAAALAVVLGLLTVGTSAAETNISVGVKGGLNVSNLTGESASAAEMSTRTGGVIGGIMVFDLSERFAIQQEILYSKKGGNGIFTALTQDSTFLSAHDPNLGYVELPLLAKYKFQTGGKLTPAILGGVSLGFSMSSDMTILSASGGDSTTSIGNSEGADFGIVLGGALDIKMKKATATVDLRYTLGLVEIFNTGDPLLQEFIARDTVGVVKVPVEVGEIYVIDPRTNSYPDIPILKNGTLTLSVGIRWEIF